MNDRLKPLLAAVDRLVVITIESASARQAAVRRLFDDGGVPFEFYFGRDSRNSSREELIEEGAYDAVARRSLGMPDLTPAEIGCAISHRDVARRIASGPDERVLIVEDDVRVIEEHIDRLKPAVDTMPASWDMAYFGYSPMNLSTPWPIRLKLLTYYPLAYLLGSERHDPRTIARIYSRPLNEFWMRAGWFNGAYAYALNRKAATVIAESQEKLSLEADVALNHLVRFTRLNAICLKYPILAPNWEMPSLIGARPSWK